MQRSLPPPSPIPTGRGSRSAANDTLIQYLHNSLSVPALVLPEPQLPPPNSNTNDDADVPSVIDFGSLISGDKESLDGVVTSAREFGAFLITGHGVSGHELNSLIRELEDRHIINTDDAWTWSVDSSRNEGAFKLVPRTGHHDVSSRSGSDKQSENLENISLKLDEMARQLGRVLVENAGIAEERRPRRPIKGERSVLRLFRCQTSSVSESQGDYSLCLHLPSSPCQLLIRTALGVYSFDAGPGTILVALGKRLEELSQESFRGVAGEVICEQNLEEAKGPSPWNSSVYLWTQTQAAIQSPFGIRSLLLCSLPYCTRFFGFFVPDPGSCGYCRFRDPILLCCDLSTVQGCFEVCKSSCLG